MPDPAEVDALTQILSAMRLQGSVFLDAEFTAPWCILSQVESEDCQPHMAIPPSLIAYHYVVEGQLVAVVDGAEPVRASAGQLLLLPRNDPHLLASKTGLVPANASALIEAGLAGEAARIFHGGGGARTRILCGYLGTDNGHDPLLSSLPTIMSVSLDADRTGRWVEESIRHLIRSLAGGGKTAARSLRHLAELLFLEAIHTFAEQQPAAERGWLDGLRDPLVGKALALIHTQPGRTWTLDELASEAGTSRSVLTDRFARLIGVAPIEYARKKRLDRAAEHLTCSNRSIASIAFEAGYSSEAAFSRTFKKSFGRSPGVFRDTTRQAR